MARSSRVVAAVTVAVACAIGVEAAAAVLSGPRTTVSRAAQAATAVARALHAAASAGTFHYRAVWSTGGLTQTIEGDAGTSAGTQTVDDAGGRLRVVLTDDVAYVRGDAAALAQQLGLSPAAARAAQGTWVAVEQGDGPYPSVEDGVTTVAALSQVLVDARTVRSPRGVGHVAVVLGRVPAGAGQAVETGSVRLEIAGRSGLPLSYAARGSDGGVPWSATISFSRWGEPLAVAAPAGAVPYAGLPPPDGSWPVGARP